MATDSAIQWTDHTWNPWQGCTKVTAGCDHCYMFRDKARYGQNPEAVVRSSAATFNRPLTAKWAAGAKVFTCSWSDWFHPEADAWRAEAWAIVKRTPHLTYQILTKRPNRIAGHLPADWGETGYPNVWLGTSVEYGATIFRVDQLARIPAAVRFVSYEPAVGPMTLGIRDRSVDWLIVGGESGGREARPFDLRWAQDVLAECAFAGIPVFVKQLGSVWARAHHAADGHGGDPAEWPAFYRVREFPGETVIQAPPATEPDYAQGALL